MSNELMTCRKFYISTIKFLWEVRMFKKNLRNNLGMEFTKDEIKEARDSNGLLTLDIELSRLCNFKCKYCYISENIPLKDELSFNEICNVIEQGQTLGVKKIIIVGGGEPLLYPKLKDIIQVLSTKGISIVMFTNGTGLNKELAEFLYIHKVGIAIKYNSQKPDIQNYLSGIEEAEVIISEAIKNLKTAGYTVDNNLLGISSVISKYNYDEIPIMWRWARDSNILPYFEVLTPQGRGRNEDLHVSAERLEKLFNQLCEIDEKEYGIKWDSIHPPIAGMSCNRHLYSCYIKSDGTVQPCSGIDLSVGNIREDSLKNIIGTSSVIKELRNPDQFVKGECGDCDLKSSCYGCRGAAYQVYNDYLAPDPLCWHNKNNL